MHWIVRATVVSGFSVAATLVPQRTSAQEPDTPYVSAQVSKWANDFHGGHRSAVLASVEDNLASSHPDPFAPTVWCDLQDSVGNLKAAWEGLKDDKVRAGLGVLPQLELDLTWDHFGGAAKVASERKGHSTSFELQAYARVQHSVGDIEGTAASMIEAMRLSPKLYVLAETTDNWMSDKTFRIVMLAALESGKIPADTPFAKAESHRSSSGIMYINDWRQVELKWPGTDQDARIQASLGSFAFRQHRFAQAVVLYKKSLAIYPFSRDRWSWLAASFMRNGEWDEAEQTTNQAASLFASNDGAVSMLKILLRAEAEADAGENGRVRRTLCLTEAPDPVPPSCAVFPETLRLNSIYLHDVAALERSSGRPALAAAALKKLSDPTQDDLLQAAEDRANANDVDGAWDAIQRVAAAIPEHSSFYFGAGSYILRVAKRAEDELKWDELGLKQFPRYLYLHQQRAHILSSVGRDADAVDEWALVFTMEDPYDAGLTDLRKALVTLDAKTADAKMAALLNQFPSVEAIWVDAAAQLSKDQYGLQSALWERAASLSPQLYWPWSHLQDLYNDHQDWQKARDALARGTQAVAKSSQTDLDNVNTLFLWQIQMESNAGGPSPNGPSAGDVAKAETILARDETDEDDLVWILRSKAKLMAVAGRQKEAATTTMQVFQLDPDDWDTGFSAVTVFYETLGVGRVMRAAYHYLDRASYDGQRLQNLTQIAVMWHPNPVEALRLLNITHQRAPAYFSDSFYGMAEGRLGDYVTLYNTNYGRGGPIGGGSPSDRYISWFDEAREHVQGPTNTIKQLNFDKDEVTLRLPDGQIVIRGWDRYGGKATLIQVGGVFIRLTYDDAENLTRIEQSNKHFIQLTYDNRDRIQKMVNTSGDVLTFKYNDINKPVEIGLEGVGAITVTYTADGAIDKVDSAAGHTVALKVSSQFQDLLDLISKVESATNDITSTPDIPLEDAELKKLEAAYQSAQVRFAYGDDSRLKPTTASSVTPPSAAQAGLQLGQYLVGHSEDSLSNTEEAEKVLYAILDSAVASHNVTAVATGARAMELLQKLYKDERPDGIGADEWHRWSAAREWLSHHDASSPEAHRVDALLERDPVRILPPDEWEPKSYLHSSGYWRAFNDPRLKNMQAVLVRRNHDYVVGTSRGILVFRQGHWVAYAHDPIARRLSNTADPSGPSSDVHALAEDASGNLWVGTASGLICVKGDYEAIVSRWSSAADGLPSGYIQALATSGNQVYVAAQGGLSYSAGDGNFRPLPEFSNAAVSSLVSVPAEHPSSDSLSGIAPAEVPPVLVATDKDVWLLRSGKAARLHPGGARSAVIDDNAVYEWTDDGLKYFNLKEDGTAGDISSVPDQEGILKSKQIFGLAVLPIEENDHAIAVLTDQGMSLYRNAHFEQQQVELLTERSAGVKALASQDLRTLVLTSEGLFSVERGQAIQDAKGEVYDLLSVPEQGVTFIARGDRLETVSQAKPEDGASTLDAISATHLALDPTGRLVANDGSTIVRYEKGSTHPTELFHAAHATEAPNHADFPEPIIRSILVASDGTIWVASGGELFRWKEGMDHPDEYGVYVDPTRFPAPTDMVSRVY
jgi:tetratricopeptide (TPR) repeat protein